MTLQAITEDVFTRYGLPAGNYKLYASAAEALFRPPRSMLDNWSVLEASGVKRELERRVRRAAW